MRSIAILLLLAAVGVTRPGGAQSPATVPADSAALGTRSTALLPEFGRNTTVMAATALGAGLVVSLVDARLLTGTQHWGKQAHFGQTSVIGGTIGGPGPIALGTALYATGKLIDNRFAEQSGREVVRAVAVSGALTALAKGLVGRSRPFASPGDADEYSPGHGFLNNAKASFPSGHTSAAFAAATVLVREIDAAHPRARWIAAPALFGGATLVGVSRVYADQHWPSDVIAGAALGSIVGFEVVAHAHGDRSPVGMGFLSHLFVRSARHGLGLGWARR